MRTATTTTQEPGLSGLSGNIRVGIRSQCPKRCLTETQTRCRRHQKSAKTRVSPCDECGYCFAFEGKTEQEKRDFLADIELYKIGVPNPNNVQEIREALADRALARLGAGK